jgi:hypothetical protein
MLTDLFEKAKKFVVEHKGKVATVAGALACAALLFKAC